MTDSLCSPKWKQPSPDIPIALKESTHFTLVGEAYFYGFMDGEALGLRELSEIIIH